MTWTAWTSEDLAELTARFPNEKTAGLAASLGRTRGAVSRRAHALGLTKADGRYQRLRTHYTVQADAFAELNPDTAYVLGVILADGSIRNDRIKITNNRLDLILACRSILRSDCRVYVPPDPKSRTFDVTIVNKQLAGDLRAWGIIENKNLIGRWPRNVPEDLFGPLLRGYFDGDGYARYNHRHGLHVKFTSGSPALLQDLAVEIGQRGLGSREVRHDKGRPNANRLNYFTGYAARVGRIMYATEGFHIAEKRQPFLDHAARPTRPGW